MVQAKPRFTSFEEYLSLEEVGDLPEGRCEYVEGELIQVPLESRPPPQLIAEVVSPGEDNETRDYQAKREQYQLIQVPEYWLIDPGKQIITVLSLVNGQYVEHGVLEGATPLQSPRWGQLPLTANQLLSACI